MLQTSTPSTDCLAEKLGRKKFRLMTVGNQGAEASWIANNEQRIRMFSGSLSDGTIGPDMSQKVSEQVDKGGDTYSGFVPG